MDSEGGKSAIAVGEEGSGVVEAEISSGAT
jgi:hypothetical protein